MAASLSGGPFFLDSCELVVMPIQLDQERRNPWVRTGVMVLVLLSCLLGVAVWRMGWLGAAAGDAEPLPAASITAAATASSLAGSEAPVAPSEPPPSEPELRARPGEVLAQDLMAEYRATRGTADGRYQGKRLKVLGRVLDLEQGESGVVLVSLQAEQDLRPLRALMAPSVASSGVQGPLLAVGRSVVLDCQHQGIVMGEPILSDCKLSPP
jgi:hypothetical protein